MKLTQTFGSQVAIETILQQFKTSDNCPYIRIPDTIFNEASNEKEFEEDTIQNEFLVKDILKKRWNSVSQREEYLTVYEGNFSLFFCLKFKLIFFARKLK